MDYKEYRFIRKEVTTLLDLYAIYVYMTTNSNSDKFYIDKGYGKIAKVIGKRNFYARKYNLFFDGIAKLEKDRKRKKILKYIDLNEFENFLRKRYEYILNFLDKMLDDLAETIL